MDNKILLDYLLNVLREPIQSYLKSHRIDALAKVAEATKERKDGEIGHSAERIYYRALTYLEMELGISNPQNGETRAGYIESVEALIQEAANKKKGMEQKSDIPFKPQANELLIDDGE